MVLGLANVDLREIWRTVDTRLEGEEVDVCRSVSCMGTLMGRIGSLKGGLGGVGG